MFDDKSKGRHEAWDIDIYYQEKMRLIITLATVLVLEKCPLRTVIGFEWTYGGSIINQRMLFYAGCRHIDFETQVDWHERRQLLKVAFSEDFHADEATVDIQFNSVRRPTPTHWNTCWDYARARLRVSLLNGLCPQRQKIR
nr:glycoside hydrolase family 38 C-terminal domain-containing protein [Paenibacillus sp. PL91]